MSCITQGKGIYRVVVGIGNDIKGEEIEQITGGKEGGFRVGNFDDLKAKTNEIHNVTCSKYLFDRAMVLLGY